MTTSWIPSTCIRNKNPKRFSYYRVHARTVGHDHASSHHYKIRCPSRFPLHHVTKNSFAALCFLLPGRAPAACRTPTVHTLCFRLLQHHVPSSPFGWITKSRKSRNIIKRSLYLHLLIKASHKPQVDHN
ncbi:hypothetical protein GUJ93_ZPchr0005g16371 [Zizania palustris]|uniref:Uncharacterized protein n=1 Tax=Zizania palustris TaxID=103762 RepID=A0A8J5SY52_ZIZPA|nr:hypothetical protein GUJ93_ZPchr0005g16371 [Zizania palustris]